MGNAIEVLQEIFQDDWDELQRRLAAKGMRLGDQIGQGAIAQVYALKNTKGETVPCAVLRVEPEGSGSTLESLGVIPVLDKTGSENFEAALVPRAEAMEKLGIDGIRPTLAVMNREGRLRHLNDLNNPIAQQFMRIPGLSIPVFVDLNAVSDTPDSVKASMGGIEQFAEQHGVSLQQLLSEKAGAAEMEKIRRERNSVVARTKEELKRFGIAVQEPVAFRGAAG